MEEFNPEELMRQQTELMEQFGTMPAEAVVMSGLFALFGVVMLFVLVPLFIAAYILLSIGLFTMAKKRNVENAWIAFIPIFGHLYMLGKLVTPLKFGETEIPNPPIFLLVGAIVSIVLNFIPLIGQLISLAFFVLVLFAFYRLYEMYSENALLYTILSVIGLSPIFVFILRNKDVKGKKKEEKKEEEKDDKEELEELGEGEEDVVERVEEVEVIEEVEEDFDDEEKE